MCPNPKTLRRFAERDFPATEKIRHSQVVLSAFADARLNNGRAPRARASALQVVAKCDNFGVLRRISNFRSAAEINGGRQKIILNHMRNVAFGLKRSGEF
jgi:hypothetical protein